MVIVHAQGESQASICRRTGVLRCPFQSLLARYQETGRVHDRPKNGRRRKLSQRDKRHHVVTSLRDRKKSISSTICDLLFELAKELLELFGAERRRHVRQRTGEELNEACFAPTVKNQS